MQSWGGEKIHITQGQPGNNSSERHLIAGVNRSARSMPTFVHRAYIYAYVSVCARVFDTSAFLRAENDSSANNDVTVDIRETVSSQHSSRVATPIVTDFSHSDHRTNFSAIFVPANSEARI